MEEIRFNKFSFSGVNALDTIWWPGFALTCWENT